MTPMFDSMRNTIGEMNKFLTGAHEILKGPEGEREPGVEGAAKSGAESLASGALDGEALWKSIEGSFKSIKEFFERLNSCLISLLKVDFKAKAEPLDKILQFAKLFPVVGSKADQIQKLGKDILGIGAFFQSAYKSLTKNFLGAEKDLVADLSKQASQYFKKA